MPARVVIFHNRVISLIQYGDVDRWTRDQAKGVERVARVIAPKRTGRLAASHVTLRTRGTNQYVNVYRVSAMAPYAAWVHEGTGIYGPLGRPIITGGWMRIPGVNPRHPTRGATVVRSTKGQRPQPWLQRAADIALHV